MDPSQIVSVTAEVTGGDGPTHREVPVTDAVRTAVAAALTPPPLPPITRRVPGPGKPDAQYGIRVVPPQKPVDRLYTDTEYAGFGNGACFQEVMGRQLLANVRITDSYGAQDTQGQGIYADKTGPTILNGSLLGWSGRPRNQPNVVPNFLRHNGYFNVGAGAVTMNDSLIVGGASAGLQTRNPLSVNKYNNSVFIDNGISVLAVMGPVVLTDCDILGGHFQWTGTAWGANSAVMNYWPVTLIRCRIWGLLGQGDPMPQKPAAPRYPSGCIVSGGTWKHSTIPFIKPPAGTPLITAQDCSIQGWPGEVFAGASPHDGKGFVVSPKPVQYDWRPVVNAYLANSITGAAAVAKLKADLSALAA